MLFRKEINPYTVTDKVTFRNGDKTLTLRVKSNAMNLVNGLRKAQAKLSPLSDDSPDSEKEDAAKAFAMSVFGPDGEKLVEFYNEPLTVINACGEYFESRLKDKIAKAQKK